MNPNPPKFLSNKDKDFYSTLKLRVRNYFADNHKTQFADWRMNLKSIFWLLVFFGTYFLILTGWFTPLQMLLLVIVFGYSMLILSLNIGHDASHHAYSRKGWVNKSLAYVFELIGANSYMWDILHNKSHHSYINIYGSDVAIETDPFLRLSTEAPHRPMHRYQHIYGFFVYSLATLLWVFWKDFRYFGKKEIGHYKVPHHPFKEYIILIFSKAFYFFYVLVIPYLVLDITIGQLIFAFVVMHLTMGFVLGITFQTTHATVDTQTPGLNDEGFIENSWAVHVVTCTSDFAPQSWLLNWCYGGLNTHNAHHLFPTICNIHYPAISKIIKETAQEYGVPYRENSSMWAAILSHVQHLRYLGNPPQIVSQAQP